MRALLSLIACLVPIFVMATPVVDSVTPNEGWTADVVVIAGSGFGGDSTVTFDGLAAAATVDSPVQITAVVPADVTSGPVVVTSGGDQSNTDEHFLALFAEEWTDGTTVKPLQEVAALMHDRVSGKLLLTSRWRGRTSPTNDAAILEFDVATRVSRRLQQEDDPSGIGMDATRFVYYASNLTSAPGSGVYAFVRYLDYDACPPAPALCPEYQLFVDTVNVRQISGLTAKPTETLVAYINDNTSGNSAVLRWTQTANPSVFSLPANTNFKVPSGAVAAPDPSHIYIDYANRLGTGGGRASQVLGGAEAYVAAPGELVTPAGMHLVGIDTDSDFNDDCFRLLIADKGNHRVIVRDLDPLNSDTPLIVASPVNDPYAVAHVPRAGVDHVYIARVVPGSPPAGKIYRYRLPDVGCGCSTGTDPLRTRLVPDNYATIQAAIDAAAPGDYILIAGGSYNENVSISAKADLTVRPNPCTAGTVILRPATLGQPILEVSSAMRLTIEDIEFRDGVALAGAAIHAVNQTGLTILQCKFVDNEATLGCGGAIGVLTGADLAFVGCLFDGNSATTDGGGLCVKMASNVRVEDSQFTDNDASLALGYGGGASFEDVDAAAIIGNVPMSTLFDGNEAWRGGAIGLVRVGTAVTVELDKLKVVNNVGHDEGGGVRVEDSERVRTTECLFTDNHVEVTAGSDFHDTGGAVSVDNSPGLWFSGNTYYRNHALSGGAIAISNTDVETNPTQIVGDTIGFPADMLDPMIPNRNEAVDYGGGLYVLDSWVEVSNCNIVANKAVMGAGVAGRGTGPTGPIDLILMDSIFSNDNPSPLSDGRLTLTDCTIRYNQADLVGGGIAALPNDPRDNYVGDWTTANGGLQCRIMGGEIDHNHVSADAVQLERRGNGAWFGGAESLGSILDNVHVHRNTGGEDGGGVAVVAFAPTIIRNGSVIEYNTAGEGPHGDDGGGMESTPVGRVRIDDSTFRQNEAMLGNGGAIQISCGSRVQLTRVTVENNACIVGGPSGGDGGGVSLRRSLLYSGGGNRIRNNGSRYNGGGVSISGGPDCGVAVAPEFTLDAGDIINDNYSNEGQGGGVALKGFDLPLLFTAHDTSVIHNQASVGLLTSTWSSSGIRTDGLWARRIQWHGTGVPIQVDGNSLFHNHPDGAAITLETVHPLNPFGNPAVFDNVNVNTNAVGLHVTASPITLTNSLINENADVGLILTDSLAAMPALDSHVESNEFQNNGVGIGVTRSRGVINSANLLRDNSLAAINVRLTDSLDGEAILSVSGNNIECVVNPAARSGVRVDVITPGLGPPPPGYGSYVHVNGNDLSGFGFNPAHEHFAYEIVADRPCLMMSSWHMDATFNWWGCPTGAAFACNPPVPDCGRITQSPDPSFSSSTELVSP